MSNYAGPSFILKKSDSILEIFITGRCVNNISRIGIAYCEFIENTLLVKNITKNPIFDIGQPGCFDENGVSYPYIVEVSDHLYMYYVGWVSGGRTRFQNFTGLAISQRDNYDFRRFSKAPILERTDKEPYGTGSCAVVKDHLGFVMLYTSFSKWKDSVDKNKNYSPSYNIKIAKSPDGLNWLRDGEVAIPNYNEMEVIGKPSLLQNQDQTWTIFFSGRGEAYKIYKATGNNLNNLITFKEPELNVSASGWDSQMVEYAHVIQIGKFQLMIYNGNNFGNTGLGYALKLNP